MRQRLQPEVMPGIEEELAHQRVGIIAVGLLDQQEIVELVGVAQEGQLVLVAARALDFGRVLQPQPGLAYQVQCDIGQRHVFLQRRPLAAQLAQLLAEDQRVIAHACQECIFLLVHLCLHPVSDWLNYRFFTSSGMGKNVGCRYTLLLAGSNSAALSPGLLATILDACTAQMLTPSLRRVYTSRALLIAISASGACRLPTCLCARPCWLRMKISHRGHSLLTVCSFYIGLQGYRLRRRAGRRRCAASACRHGPPAHRGTRRRLRRPGPGCAGGRGCTAHFPSAPRRTRSSRRRRILSAR